MRAGESGRERNREGREKGERERVDEMVGELENMEQRGRVQDRRDEG